MCVRVEVGGGSPGVCVRLPLLLTLVDLHLARPGVCVWMHVCACGGCVCVVGGGLSVIVGTW